MNVEHSASRLPPTLSPEHTMELYNKMFFDIMLILRNSTCTFLCLPLYLQHIFLHYSFGCIRIQIWGILTAYVKLSKTIAMLFLLLLLLLADDDSWHERSKKYLPKTLFLIYRLTSLANASMIHSYKSTSPPLLPLLWWSCQISSNKRSFLPTTKWA